MLNEHYSERGGESVKMRRMIEKGVWRRGRLDEMQRSVSEVSGVAAACGSSSVN
jgi:hypothetical protein